MPPFSTPVAMVEPGGFEPPCHSLHGHADAQPCPRHRRGRAQAQVIGGGGPKSPAPLTFALAASWSGGAVGGTDHRRAMSPTPRPAALGRYLAGWRFPNPPPRPCRPVSRFGRRLHAAGLGKVQISTVGRLHPIASVTACWWRVPDLNRRPFGYEPNALTSCANPHQAARPAASKGLLTGRATICQ